MLFDENGIAGDEVLVHQGIVRNNEPTLILNNFDDDFNSIELVVFCFYLALQVGDREVASYYTKLTSYYN